MTEARPAGSVSALLPVLTVGAAAFGWLPLSAALWIAALSLVLTIAAPALVATRRTAVRWPVKLLAHRASRAGRPAAVTSPGPWNFTAREKRPSRTVNTHSPSGPSGR